MLRLVRMALCPKIKLNDGNNVPLIGLGTSQATKQGEIFEAVKCAIENGYRHIDCALIYENEKEVGNGIKEKINDKTISREEIFVTSKAWNTFHRKEKVIEGCQLSLRNLQLDYLDLYLVHWPIAFKEGDELTPKDENGKMLTENIDFTETWKGMEECKEKGLVKSIGLSNFNSVQIKKILDMCKIKPAMLQVECHPYLNQKKLVEFCKNHDIAVTAYSPLGSPDRPWCAPDEPILLEDKKIKEIGDKYNKSPAQVLLRFNVQREVIVVPRSVKKERILNNFQIFDFELTPDEMHSLSNYTTQFRYCDFFKEDANYPFSVEY